MTLLTPPSSSHRLEKENFRFTVTAPLPGRVVWSSQNSYHSLTTPLKPCVASKERPVKSILKRRQQTPTLLAVPDDNTEQREVTPEPADPLVNLNYLEHPVSKILKGTDASLRDLIEGYSVLAVRLRASVTGSTDGDASWPLFQPLRKNRQAFVDAVVRDLGRALIDPASAIPSTEEVMDEWMEDEEKPPKFTLPSPQSSPLRKKRGMSAEQAKYARDLATTCLSVIRLLSVMLTTPAIYSIFEGKDLSTILTSILAIPLANELPTPNARKTRALAIWLLQVQRLPSDVLHLAGDRIAYALRRGIDGELGKEGKKGSANDGLKAVHDLSIFQPATFVPSFTEVLPSILANLLAPTLALRTQACHALGGFVLGSISIPQSHHHTRISDIIANHLTTIPVTPTKKSPSKLSEAPIVRTLRTTMAAVDPTHVAQGPVWAISVLSCFIVLLGSKLYTDRKLGRLVCSLLSLGKSHKKSTVRGLMCIAWRVVAWAYFTPPLPVETGEESEVEEGNEVVRTDAFSKEPLWNILVSVVDCQAGIATIAGLMSDESEEGLRKTIETLQAMMNKAGRTCGDAVVTLQHLLCFESRTRKWNVNHLIPDSLFSSNPGLLTADFKNLLTAVQPLLRQVPTVEDIRCLTREEIAKDWVFDGLISVWRTAVGFLEMGDEGMPEELVFVWKSLLKSTVELLQESEDKAGIVAFGRRAAGILAEILGDSNIDFTLKPAPAGAEKPTTFFGSDAPVPEEVTPGNCTNGELKLRTVQKLWTTMRVLFPIEQLGDAGEHLLKSLIDNERELVDPLSEGTARAAWSSMCTDVLSVCDVDAIREFWGCEEGERAKKWDWTNEDKEIIWKTCTEKWKEVEGHWQGGVVLLGVPFTDANQWGFRTEDDAQWSELLEQVIGKAFDYGLDSNTVLNNIAAFISANQSPTSGVASTRAAEILISHLDIVEAREIPEVLVEFVNDTMRSTYPPEPRNKPVSLWLVRNVTQMVADCPVELCLQMLETLQEGLCLWLSDECECWSMDELDYNIIPLYQFLLVKIRGLPQDTATLDTLAPILDSVFSGRAMPPAAAEAFNEYWQFTYANMPVPEAGWPSKILHCLGLDDDASKDAPSQDSPTSSPTASIIPPSTPLTSSFPSQSPQRPHKPVIAAFETFPLPMRSPASPVRRRTASSSSYTPTTPKRTPLASIYSQSGGSPAKRRRIGDADEEESANKENASPHPQTPVTPIQVTVAERIAASGLGLKSNSPKKRHFVDEEASCSELDTNIARPSPTKKLKLRERMCAKTTKTITPKSKAASTQLASPPSTCSSKESEDERWVENALLPLPSLLPFPMQGADGQNTSEEYSCPPTPTPVTRKRVFMEAVVVPTLQQVQRKRKLEHSQSFESLMTKSSSEHVSLPPRRTPRIMRRSVSEIVPASRKRRRSSDSDPFVVISSTSAPLPALRVTRSVSQPKTYCMRSQKMSSSDDDPHHLISPTMGRKFPYCPMAGADVFTSEAPGSDDSTVSLESPTKDMASRRRQRIGPLTKVFQW